MLKTQIREVLTGVTATEKVKQDVGTLFGDEHM